MASGAGFGVMGVLGDRAGEAGWILVRVAFEAEFVAGLEEVGPVLVAVDLVAIEAADLAMVHVALDEVVALHAVLVGGEVGVLQEVGGAGFQLFQLPEVGETLAGEEADGPVVVLAGDGIGEGLALAVALDAGVVGADGVEGFGIDDVGAGGVLDVDAAGSVTFFTADVPLGDLFGGDVVVDGVASVAGGTGGTVEVGGTVEGDPPVGSRFDVVGEPELLLDVPLGRQGVVVVSAAGEESLFPAASVDEGDVFEGEGAKGLRVGEVGEDGFGVLFGGLNDVRHAGLLPAVVGVAMALFAAFGADEAG